MVTKESFILFARALRNVKPNFETEHELELFDLVVSSFIAECTAANPRFDRTTYMAAIYGPYSTDTI